MSKFGRRERCDCIGTLGDNDRIREIMTYRDSLTRAHLVHALREGPRALAGGRVEAAGRRVALEDGAVGEGGDCGGGSMMVGRGEGGEWGSVRDGVGGCRGRAVGIGGWGRSRGSIFRS